MMVVRHLGDRSLAVRDQPMHSLEQAEIAVEAVIA